MLPTQPRSEFHRSFLVKVLLLGLLWLALLIPLAQVRSLVEERQRYQNSVVSEVGANWGGAQTLAGPVLSVPYRVFERYVETTDMQRLEKVRTSVRWQHFLPEDLKISGQVEAFPRHRGIFETVVYKGDLRLEGTFGQPELVFAESNEEREILWQEAVVTLGVSDLRGLRSALDLQWQGRSAQLTPATLDPAGWELALLSAPVVLQREGQPRYTFGLSVGLNGSGRLAFLPLGRQTQVALNSPWANPSFEGAYLPDDRQIGPSGFTANWQIPFFARNFPQQWRHGESPSGMMASSFGVDLMVPVDVYAKTDRALKYAGLFVLFTFMAFLLFELFENRNLHVIQYLLVGFAMSVFYLLLLSLAEHLTFATAYGLAATGVTLVIAGYAHAVLGSRRGAGLLGGILVLLYGFLFVLLKSQDYALLIGSIALFLVLATVMYITRHVQWSAPRNLAALDPKAPPAAPPLATGDQVG